MGNAIKLKFNAYALFSGWEPTIEEEAQLHELIVPMLQAHGLECDSVIWISQNRFIAMGVLDGVVSQPPVLDGPEGRTLGGVAGDDRR
jgi:hypothetical protein